MKLTVSSLVFCLLASLYALTINIYIDNHKPWSMERCYTQMKFYRTEFDNIHNTARKVVEELHFQFIMNMKGLDRLEQEQKEDRDEYKQYILEQTHIIQVTLFSLSHTADYAEWYHYNNQMYMDAWKKYMPREI